MHQTCETSRSRIVNLMTLAPAGRNEHTQQEDDGIDEKDGHRLCNGEVKRTHFLTVDLLYDFTWIGLGLTTFDTQSVRTRTVALLISMMREL